MSVPRVFCLGEVLFDCLSDQPGRPLSAVESWSPYPGGAPANVACALIKLGTPSGFIGCVGNDSPGNDLVELLKEVGVDVTGVQYHPTAPTRQVYVVRSLEGDRTFAGFGSYDTTEFADTRLKASELPSNLLERAEFLVLGTLELAYPETKEAIARSLELAKQHNVKIFIDVNWRPVFWPNPDIAPDLIKNFLQQADFVKFSEEEAEWLFDTTDPKAIANQFNNLKGVLVTAGEKGCAYCLSNNEGKIPAFKVKVIDTTGAGDSFVAGFVHQLCQNGIESLGNPDTANRIVFYASAVGAMTTMKPGAIASQPTAAEVEDFLRSHSNLSS